MRFCTAINAAVIACLIPLSGIASEPAGAMVFQQDYVPGVWVAPDGCEYWVLDDGAEGYMTPHVRVDGTPVCRKRVRCGVVDQHVYFDTDRATLTSSGRSYIENFFRRGLASAYVIEGHTDSRASDAYNVELSARRAMAVSNFARQMGVNIVATRAKSESEPVASNNTAAGMALNRRVEIMCLNRDEQ